MPANCPSLGMASRTTSSNGRLCLAQWRQLRAESQPKHLLLLALARRCISPEQEEYFNPEEEECCFELVGPVFCNLVTQEGDHFALCSDLVCASTCPNTLPHFCVTRTPMTRPPSTASVTPISIPHNWPWNTTQF